MAAPNSYVVKVSDKVFDLCTVNTANDDEEAVRQWSKVNKKRRRRVKSVQRSAVARDPLAEDVVEGVEVEAVEVAPARFDVDSAEISREQYTVFAQRRLQHDLKEVRRASIAGCVCGRSSYTWWQVYNNPLELVCAAPINDNLFEWHANIIAPKEHKLSGLVFHLRMVFPFNYPNAPPELQIFTTLHHNNVFRNGEYICLVC